MICPLCKTDTVRYEQASDRLIAPVCSSCQGTWIRFEDYMGWCNHSENPMEVSWHDAEMAEHLHDGSPSQDSKQVKICPDCGRILIKYRVHKDLDFYLDHCGTCNGVWLDRNEWESLIRCNLHRYLYKLFTDPWQKKLQEDLTRMNLEKHYLKKFGPEDYEKIKSIKEWLKNNANKDDLLAYLIAENPYKF